MSNLGGYQTMVKMAKAVGGPKRLVAIVGVVGYAVGRPVEARVKKTFKSFKQRSRPCETKGQLFQVTSDGDGDGLRVRVGDQYRVLECDGEAILIEVLGDPDNPHVLSSQFLRSVSDYRECDEGTASQSNLEGEV